MKYKEIVYPCLIYKESNTFENVNRQKNLSKNPRPPLLIVIKTARQVHLLVKNGGIFGLDIEYRYDFDRELYSEQPFDNRLTEVTKVLRI